MLIPSRPLEIRSSYAFKKTVGGTLLMLIGAALVIAFAFFQFRNARQLLAEAKIWEQGVPARGTRVGGKVHATRLILKGYDLDVAFIDARGEPHTGKIKFDTLFGAVDDKAQPVVHYIESEPSRFALNWAVDARKSRWMAILFLVVMGVFVLGGVSLATGWNSLSQLRLARACARESTEHLLPVTQVIQRTNMFRRPELVYIFRFEKTPGKHVVGEAVFPLKQTPLFADANRKALVGLVSSAYPTTPFVPEADFSPFKARP